MSILVGVSRWYQSDWRRFALQWGERFGDKGRTKGYNFPGKNRQQLGNLFKRQIGTPRQTQNPTGRHTTPSPHTNRSVSLGPQTWITAQYHRAIDIINSAIGIVKLIFPKGNSARRSLGRAAGSLPVFAGSSRRWGGFAAQLAEKESRPPGRPKPGWSSRSLASSS